VNIWDVLDKKNHYFLLNCCFEKDGGDCCAKILKTLKKNKEKKTMNCFSKMGSLAKIIDLTTWPHNNHIFQTTFVHVVYKTS
jgi:hypothetical protein